METRKVLMVGGPSDGERVEVLRGESRWMADEIHEDDWHYLDGTPPPPIEVRKRHIYFAVEPHIFVHEGIARKRRALILKLAEGYRR